MPPLDGLEGGPPPVEAEAGTPLEGAGGGPPQAGAEDGPPQAGDQAGTTLESEEWAQEPDRARGPESVRELEYQEEPGGSPHPPSAPLSYLFWLVNPPTYGQIERPLGPIVVLSFC